MPPRFRSGEGGTTMGTETTHKGCMVAAEHAADVDALVYSVLEGRVVVTLSAAAVRPCPSCGAIHIAIVDEDVPHSIFAAAIAYSELVRRGAAAGKLGPSAQMAAWEMASPTKGKGPA